jgi:hypothetical protein
VFVHPRESSDNPRLNAFCRVAPSLRLRLRAIFPAGVLLRAADFNSRTSVLVQRRRFEFFLAMYGSPNPKACAYTWKCFQTKVFVRRWGQRLYPLPFRGEPDRPVGGTSRRSGATECHRDRDCRSFCGCSQRFLLGVLVSSAPREAFFFLILWEVGSKRSFLGCPCPGKVPLELTYGGCVRERS